MKPRYCTNDGKFWRTDCDPETCTHLHSQAEPYPEPWFDITGFPAKFDGLGPLPPWVALGN